jgi:hypothetical protein
MVNKLIEWFFSPTEKMIVEEIDVYSKLIELEEKYNKLLDDVKILQEENIETTNILYEIENTLDMYQKND